MKEYQKQKFLEIIIHKWLLKLQVFAILRRAEGVGIGSMTSGLYLVTIDQVIFQCYFHFTLPFHFAAGICGVIRSLLAKFQKRMCWKSFPNSTGFSVKTENHWLSIF